MCKRCFTELRARVKSEPAFPVRRHRAKPRTEAARAPLPQHHPQASLGTAWNKAGRFLRSPGEAAAKPGKGLAPKPQCGPGLPGWSILKPILKLPVHPKATTAEVPQLEPNARTILKKSCRLGKASPSPLCSASPVPVHPSTVAPISSEDFEQGRKQHMPSKLQKQSPNKGRKI